MKIKEYFNLKKIPKEKNIVNIIPVMTGKHYKEEESNYRGDYSTETNTIYTYKYIVFFWE